MNDVFDVIIIGKGPAGISASLYTSRANLKTLIIGEAGSLSKAHLIDNYFGFENGISGSELLKQGENQAKRLGTGIIEDQVIALEFDYVDKYTVKTGKGTYHSNAVLLATGSQKKSIIIENIDKFEGKGIHYCTTCDGFFYKGKKVAILGYNEYAKNELEEMKHFTEDITLLTNGNKKTVDFEGVKIFEGKLKSLNGGEFLESIIFEDGNEEKFDAVFIAYGTASSVDFARKLGVIIKDGTVEVDDEQKTNLKGLYAAGDCAGTIKQVSVSVGQGAIAGLKIIEYIRNFRR
ncbi:thioredoxin reductase [Oxobacter pfennigii]|uniref:Thioredoxin reductase n=1 Tax=Oxobacter pfennigii TaxID=36849 RepID=A0A0P8WDB8_9CLOT|nr:NAD(P)/FAD-dependent oxidoreductase [Oxobacter pfennigii]KPU45891.1 thioredoxin reductase [Oxobacter pfennigii]